ncbi:MAG: hypothetical protein COY39_02825 [Alphaproteobacteria bacterium CG_4_10_14_0_8_um_filter_37_21]|nr:MAG: hypothetical protein COY39_02825 [Alphaproteobacteria bacterium CG_4_10_14_0_8_um_filter_37_21]
MRFILSLFIVIVNFQNIQSCSLDFKELHKKNIYFIFDHTSAKDKKLPKRFQISKKISIPRTDKHQKELYNFTHYNLSASAQFSPAQFQEILSYLRQQYCVEPSQVYVVDLREEPHFFINDRAISAGHIKAINDNDKFGSFVGMPESKLVEMEEEYCRMLLRQENIHIHQAINKKTRNVTKRYEPIWVGVKAAQSEKNLVESTGAHYKRFPITDHQHPTDILTQDFIAFINSLPENAWVHFHCRGGKGRTGTAVFMYDVLKNKGNFEFPILLKRSLLFGISRNIFTINLMAKTKIKTSKARKAFLTEFYRLYNKTT